MKKARFLGLLAAVLVLTAVLTLGASADGGHGEVTHSGACGDDLTWTLYEDGLLEIGGRGI